LILPIQDEAEVTPPREAGEDSRAYVTTITPNDDAPARSVQVVWVEPGQPILGAVLFRGPAVLESWEFTSALVQRQRQRLVQMSATAVPR
jgi:hypothetical protein